MKIRNVKETAATEYHCPIHVGQHEVHYDRKLLYCPRPNRHVGYNIRLNRIYAGKFVPYIGCVVTWQLGFCTRVHAKQVVAKYSAFNF